MGFYDRLAMRTGLSRESAKALALLCHYGASVDTISEQLKVSRLVAIGYRNSFELENKIKSEKVFNIWLVIYILMGFSVGLLLAVLIVKLLGG